MGLPCNAGDPGQIPGSGRSPGGGCGNTLQSCLENPTDRGAWQATVHGVAKSWTRLKRTSCGAPACLPSSVDSTQLAQVGDGRPAELPEGMRTWAGEGPLEGGAAARHKVSPCSRGSSSKDSHSQLPASCADPHGAHLLAAPGLFTVVFIESD